MTDTSAEEQRRERRLPDLPEDQRTPFQRDRDRLLYSTAFHRLAGVTQVASPAEGRVIHNRLTHSLEVAQIGRRLAEKLGVEQSEIASRLGGLNADVVEAASLAHDLGHPPFGHIAEYELCRLIDDADPAQREGFEGNAQSFRIVNELEHRVHRFFGLNLTRATLGAILKYPRLRPASTGPNSPEKWGVYSSESHILQWVGGGWAPVGDRTLEAEIMDWADDIAYSVHDVDDFFRVGLLPLDQLERRGSPERRRFRNWAMSEVAPRHHLSAEDLDRLLDRVLGRFAETTPFRGSREQHVSLRTFTSGQINRCITSTQLNNTGTPSPAIVVDPEVIQEVDLLKGLTRFFVIKTPALATQQVGQRRVVRTLFETFFQAASRGDDRANNQGGDQSDVTIIPLLYQEQLVNAGSQPGQIARIVGDLIASMTEAQAIRLYRRVTGVSLGYLLDPIV